jgi:hypothetical protein
MIDHALQERMVDENQAATLLGCTVSCLRAWRARQFGPTYLKIGRLVRYRNTDLIAWSRARSVHPKSLSRELSGNAQGALASEKEL